MPQVIAVPDRVVGVDLSCLGWLSGALRSYGRG